VGTLAFRRNKGLVGYHRLAMGIATVFVIPSNIEPWFWLLIFGVCAFLIARVGVQAVRADLKGSHFSRYRPEPVIQ